MNFNAFLGALGRQYSSSGENPLQGHRRYQNIRALGRGSYGTFSSSYLDRKARAFLSLQWNALTQTCDYPSM
jgi:hypothetical protein